MFDLGDEIVCKQVRHSRFSGKKVHLTKGKVYRVEGARGAEVEVRNDEGEFMYYANSRFVIALDPFEPTEEELRILAEEEREVELTKQRAAKLEEEEQAK